MSSLLAQDVEGFIPIVAILMVFGIPFVAILTHHQRKMAELFHQKRGQDMVPALMDEVQRLRAEVQDMKSELHQTAIVLDDVRATRQAGQRPFEERVRENS